VRILAGAAGRLPSAIDPRRRRPLATHERNCCLPKTFEPEVPLGILGPRSIATLGPTRRRGKSAISAGILALKTGIKLAFLAILPTWLPIDKIDRTHLAVSISRQFPLLPAAETLSAIISRSRRL
jgi:hypothetical protein